jgi:hypothetical protein
MNATHTLTRAAALVAGALFALTGSLRAAETDALPAFDNYIKVSGTLPSVSGSKAAFERRAQYSKDGAGGIEAFNYDQDLSKETAFHADGHLLPGAGDYLAQFKLTKTEVGSFEMGYNRFRTFYDGAGGFFPNNNAWITLYPRERYVDRAKFFVNGTVALPQQPVFTFRYTNELRNGKKDSTIWGDSDLTGIPIYSLSSLNPITSTRKILPAYIQLGERQQEWEASVRQTVGNSTATFSIIGTQINNLDTRTVDRYTGELKPFPAIPSNPPTLVSPTLANNPNKGFDQHGFKETALTYVGKLETKLSETATAYAEASYRHATGDLVDTRLITLTIATGAGAKDVIGGYTVGGRPPYSYASTGTTKNNVFTGVIGVRTNPLKELAVDFAVRGEDCKFTNQGYANYVSNQVVLASGVVTPIPAGGPNSSKIHEKPWTPAIDARYTGLGSVTLYASWDYRSLTQDERTTYAAYTADTVTGALSAPVTLSFDNIKEKHSNVKLGANWSPNISFTLRPELFTKDHEDRFVGYGASLGNYYLLNYDIYGARVTAIARVLPGLTFNTRYVVQRGKADLADANPSRPEVNAKSNANDSRRYQLCETIDWVPNKSLYVQGNVNLVYDTIVTSLPYATGLAQTVLRNSDNNYWNGSLLLGFVVDKETDAQIQSTYYKANNYAVAQAATMLPYGAGGKESTVTVGVKHKFSDRLLGNAKIGYCDSKNDTSGGNANFRGPIAYVALEYRL